MAGQLAGATLRGIDARVLITGALIAAICAIFWLDSRYPSLEGKSGADPRQALATPLGFEKHWPEPPPDQRLKHIGWTAAEWAVTNRQGMTFGLLLAAGLLTIVPLLPRARGGRFAGALQGALIGAPLGVCVNCAAPIGQAMLKAGSRVEVALATVFTSPSFNVIVISMLITLFPWHLVLLKLTTSALMVAVAVPWLARSADRPGWRKPLQETVRLPGLRAFQWVERIFGKASSAALDPGPRAPFGWLHAIGWVAVRYAQNLWIVVKLALPLMLLAGLLGAVLVEVLPWQLIMEMARVEGVAHNALLLLLVTAFGVLLPVPIAFDIILCSVLWNAGVPIHVVAALLVTLGLYSVYPWSLLGMTLSWRIATLAGVAVYTLGITAGAAAGILESWHEIRLAREAAAVMATLPAPAAQKSLLPVGRTAAELREGALSVPAMRRVLARDEMEIWSAPFVPATSLRGPTPFTRIDGATVGFERLPLPRLYKSTLPGVMEFGGLAAGDVDGNGFPDVAVGTHFGVFLYRNFGGLFRLQQVDFPQMRDWISSGVALVDFTGDGAPDLFFCAWMHGCHILVNQDGAFSKKRRIELPRLRETSVSAVAIADVDRDGDLDIVTGTSTFAMMNFYPAPAVNRVWYNHGSGTFRPEPLTGPEGETLALLFTDLNADGWPDLIVGNDFDEPDRVYLNERGQLRPVTARDSPIPYSTDTTMSLDSGDLDNDGRAELYIGQIAMGSPGADFARRLARPLESCSLYSDVADRSRCDTLAQYQMLATRGRATESIAPCRELADPVQQRDCVVTTYHWHRVLFRLPALRADRAQVLRECAGIPADFDVLHDICAAIAESPMDYDGSRNAFPDELRSVERTNLLFRPADAGYRDITADWRAGFGGWTWNAKFADLDQDGWQDLYVAQGSRLRLTNVSAVFYRNQSGTGFREDTKAFGLQDHRPTGSSLFLDYDVDGDLDVISYPFLLTPVVWRNDAPAGAGFEVTLDDRRSGNRHGIGARVVIQAPDGRVQMRDIKASGGYQSHDLPIARFGLGDWPAVASLEITWPDGTSQKLLGPALGPGRYTLIRGGPSSSPHGRE